LDAEHRRDLAARVDELERAHDVHVEIVAELTHRVAS
jgi:hypothetical protein